MADPETMTRNLLVVFSFTGLQPAVAHRNVKASSVTARIVTELRISTASGCARTHVVTKLPT